MSILPTRRRETAREPFQVVTTATRPRALPVMDYGLLDVAAPPRWPDRWVFGPPGTLGRAKPEPQMDARECKGCRVAWSGDAGEDCWHCGQPGRRPW